jgi:hypothetical protein
VNRHRAAAAAGVPVPLVRDSFAELGVVVFDELPGPLLKDEIKAGRPAWPKTDEFDRLAVDFARINDDLPIVPSRVRHGVLHAQMLRSVGAVHADQLDRLVGTFSTFRSNVEPQTIHGDLHEGQIVVDGGRIIGVLDLDDLGTGSSLEERANLLGFLRYRAVTLPAQRHRITEYADQLRHNSSPRYDLIELDIATAAVIVGLATGPFRIQQTGWHDTVSTLIAHAVAHLPAAPTHIAVGPTSTHNIAKSSPPLEES